jgi:hypothetical protein
MRRRLRRVIEIIRIAMLARPGGDQRGTQTLRRKTRQRGEDDNHRKRRGKEKDRDKGGPGNRHHKGILQRPLADPKDRLHHHRQNGGLDAKEQRLDKAEIAEPGIQDAEDQDHYRARQHEQDTGNQPAQRPVQQPADIGRQLLCLRPRQQHAVIERVQKPALADPIFSSTSIRCISAICPAGPPKLSRPIFSHTFRASPSEGADPPDSRRSSPVIDTPFSHDRPFFRSENLSMAANVPVFHGI